MSHLLRAAAVLLLVWAISLLLFRSVTVPGELSAPVHAMVNGWGLANLALAVVFWDAGSDPPRHLGAIFAALLTMAFKTGNDLYCMLSLPPPQALATVADIVLSSGLLVGMLRELPRTIEAARGNSPD